MATDLNQCSFIGRLGADPEARAMPDGKAISNFRIAVGWKTKASEGTEWVPVVAYGKLAEICNEYLRKGKQVFIQGRMRTRSWEKDGETKYMTEIHVDNMQMLGDRGQQDQGAAPSSKPASKSGGFDNMDDDIPF